MSFYNLYACYVNINYTIFLGARNEAHGFNLRPHNYDELSKKFRI